MQSICEAIKKCLRLTSDSSLLDNNNNNLKTNLLKSQDKSKGKQLKNPKEVINIQMEYIPPTIENEEIYKSPPLHHRVKGQKNKLDCSNTSKLDLDKSSTSLLSNISKSPTSHIYHKFKLTDFTILKLLGAGTFGKVYLAKKGEKLYAMKILSKDKIIKTKQTKNTMNEKQILERINFPYIVKGYYAFQDHDKLYLVTEFMQGGELFYYIKTKGRLDENEIRGYSAEIILAGEHGHQKNIGYRDGKPENILLDSKGFIKLADFGLSKIFLDQAQSSVAYSFCGTLEYLAPEIMMGQGYGSEVDWWSFGVGLYEMFTGKTLFKRKTYSKPDINIYLSPINGNNENICVEGKDLILSLLKGDVRKRLKEVDKIKGHAFYKGINWDDVGNRNIQPMYVPNIVGLDDVSCFDPKFTKNVDALKEGNNKNSGNDTVNSNNPKGSLSAKAKYNKNAFDNFSYQRPEGDTPG